MARPVKVKTPVPTLEEFGKDLGLSKARQKDLAPVFVERRRQGDFVVRRGGSMKASYISPTQREAVEKARELSPNRAILIERVRDSSHGGQDKWRRAN